MTDSPDHVKVQIISETVTEGLEKDCTPQESMEVLCTCMVAVFLHSAPQVTIEEFIEKINGAVREIYNLNTEPPTARLQ